MIRKLLLALVTTAAFLVAVLPVDAASKRTSTDVKKDRQRTEKQIAKTKKQIAENEREIGRQLSRLQSIKADIARQNDTIEMLRVKLDSVGSAIGRLNDTIASMEAREDALRANYALSLRTMRARRQGMSDLSFVFSSKSFSEAWRRLRYLREIAKAGAKQARQIEVAKGEAVEARNRLEGLKATRSDAVARQNAVQAELRTEQSSADNIVRNLKKQGKSLQRELEKRSQQAKALDRELDKIVEQEIKAAEERRRKEAEAERQRQEAIAKAEAERRRKEDEQNRKSQTPDRKEKTPDRKDKATSPTPSTPQQKPDTKPAPKPREFESEAEKDRRLSGSFASNKGKLLFPVAGRYSIVSNFGTNELPELSKVKVDNLGIDIEVPAGTAARSVFEGVVSSIFRLDGYNNIVIVRHGEYLSVYAGIDALSVKKGDKVKGGQNLGKIAKNGDHSRLHFEIRHEKQKLNPAEWVK